MPFIEHSDCPIEHSDCPAYLLEPTSGMHCPLNSGLGMNIFLTALLLVQGLVQFEFSNQMADLEVIM